MPIPPARRLSALARVALVLWLSGLVRMASANPVGTTHYPDFENVIPASEMSIVQTPEGREFRYTHQLFNSGAGPLEIQPEYNFSAGVYQGVQHIYTHNAATAWSVVETVPIAGAFEFHAEHGHFHFPLASFGLYSVAANGGIGVPVTLSPKNGFCIADSFLLDKTLPHWGEFGDWGSCSDPLSVRGVSVGAVDEYDYRDPGQSVPIDGLPDGTYWFRAIVDPFDYLVESDESNNETDVKITIANNSVQVLQTATPDSTPPMLDLTTPADGATLSGIVTLSASNLVGGSVVQFLLDGEPLGSPDLAPPYAASWDSRTTTNGAHWLAARSVNELDIGGTSDVARVTVLNGAPSGVLDIDQVSFSDGTGTRSASVSTTAANGLLLAFVAADGPSSAAQTATVSGGGLAWSLARRANGQPGTSEIWTAIAAAPLAGATISSALTSGGYDQSLTVIAFRGAEGLGAAASGGASTGAPGVQLTSTEAGSWTFGVGNDWDNATPRTLPAGQTMQHQWVDSRVGDTFWVQSQSAPVASAGASVGIGVSAPTTDRWNLAAVEVLPAAATDSTPPTLTLTDPVADSTLSGNVVVSALATDDQSVPEVQFYVDGAPLGAPASTPPFITVWDTRTASNGPHTLTASATDAAGNVGHAEPVEISVDNPALPPDPIALDVVTSFDGSGTLTTLPFSTTQPGDLLVAFVAYAGPESGGQTALVSGAGLTWTLVKRSNAQLGTSEIWSAKATGLLSDVSVSASPGIGSGWYGSLVVIAFANAEAPGIASAASAPTGAPNIYVPGVSEANWVFAVGNDGDGAVARTPVANQVIVHQRLEAAVGDTYWVQSTASPSTVPGIVDIRDSAPVDHQWNYAAVEIVASRVQTCPAGPDADGDGVCDPSDNCPTVANPEQADGDGDAVGTLCDNCTEVANPRVGPGFLSQNPWATLTGGQRDDDHDGFGNRCDAKFPGVRGSVVNLSDRPQFDASLGEDRRLDTCGTTNTTPCAVFDLDGSGTNIQLSDGSVFNKLFGRPRGPRCPDCTGTGSILLPCTAGSAGSCD